MFDEPLKIKIFFAYLVYVLNKISVFFAIEPQFVKLILMLEFQDVKNYTKLLLFSSPAYFILTKFCQRYIL